MPRTQNALTQRGHMMTKTKLSAQNRPVLARRAPLHAAILIALAAMAVPGASAAPLDVARVPLVLGGSLEPNLMYIHDDSGSMAWGYLPDSISGADDKNRGHSSHYNKMYYNPAVTYRPPVNHAGSRGDADFNNAWKNGYALDRDTKTGGKVNLSTSFRHTWNWGQGASDQWEKVTWTGPEGGQPAYYFVFDASNNNCDSDEPDKDDDCYDKVIVGPAEHQNFANWYSYYRVRNFAAKAGISLAFSKMGNGIRVGYGRINKSGSSTIDGKSVTTIERGVRKFEGDDRKAFFDWLFETLANGSTHSRRALDAAGQYYENDADKGPWSTTPGEIDGNNLSCRKSYTLLMSDGYWNGNKAATTAARANVDGAAGTTIKGFNGQTPVSYTYSASAPFKDSNSNTLADVAMYYWKRDLNPGLANKVPTSERNPAFWQHMSTFTVGLGVTGSVDPDDAFDAIATGATIPWPTPAEGSENNIDDMLHASVNSRGGFYQANDPDEFAAALENILAAIINDNASVARMAQSSSQARSDTDLYAGGFDSAGWTGSLVSRLTDGTVNWEASIPAHTTRKIVTWDNGSDEGNDFTWSGLTDLQKTQLNDNASLFAYLRGDKTNEGETSGKFRARNSLLGDIVNSAPAYVGTQDFGYGQASGLTETERTAYATRRASTAYKTRPEMVYVGANDGMLHAFNATSGVEQFAFVPSATFGNLKHLAAQDYQHRYYVDGAPIVRDAYLGSWKSVLVGATGAGGRSYFAMDVDNPSAFSKNSVLWEFTHDELGQTIGEASIVKTESGHWVAIFGNGYNSNSQRAQLFVVNLSDGTLLKKIDTATGAAATPNGMATPVAIDSDANGLVDLVYAGDYRGNLWKFDVSGKTTDTWKVAHQDGGLPRPLFKTVDRGDHSQPITSKPNVGRHPEKGLIAYVGTGKFFLTGDQGDLSEQSIYGVFDECPPLWEGHEARPEPVAGCADPVGTAKVLRSNLLEQKIFYEDQFGNRGVTSNTLSTEKGFYIDMIPPSNEVKGERIISQPSLLFDGRVQFTSLIPNDDPCSAGTFGWTMQLDPFSGGRLDYSVFDVNLDGSFDKGDYITDPVTGDEISTSGRRFDSGNGFATNLLGLEKNASIICSGDECIDVKSSPTTSGRQSWSQVQ